MSPFKEVLYVFGTTEGAASSAPTSGSSYSSHWDGPSTVHNPVTGSAMAITLSHGTTEDTFVGFSEVHFFINTTPLAGLDLVRATLSFTLRPYTISAGAASVTLYSGRNLVDPAVRNIGDWHYDPSQPFPQQPNQFKAHDSFAILDHGGTDRITMTVDPTEINAAGGWTRLVLAWDINGPVWADTASDNLPMESTNSGTPSKRPSLEVYSREFFGGSVMV